MDHGKPFWERGGSEGLSEHCEGSLEHCRGLGTEVGLAVMERRIIGPLCYFSIFVKILPGSTDHWIIGANWNYLHITSLYCLSDDECLKIFADVISV